MEKCCIAQGYEVYLAEQPARGRSAWHPEVNGKIMHHPIASLEGFTSNQGEWSQSKKHTEEIQRAITYVPHMSFGTHEKTQKT